MSFMFNPYPYEDNSAVNRPKLSTKAIKSVISGTKNVALYLTDVFKKHLQKSKTNSVIVGMDGYISAQWEGTIELLSRFLQSDNIDLQSIDITGVYKSSEVIDTMLAENLPEDREKDPVLLFGKLFKHGFEDMFEEKKLNELEKQLQLLKKNQRERPTIVVVKGNGAGIKRLRSIYDLLIYYDVTPKQTVLRIKKGLVKNIGDSQHRSYKRIMRRCYYVDFEIAAKLREEILNNNEEDYYVASDDPENIQLLPKDTFNEICAELVKRPFRCKPVYNEGVWGGYFAKKIRNLPKEMKNCAWVFDLIPLEVSILVEVGNQLVEIPYFTFVKKEGVALMGQKCVKKFHGYFPIRFNYDDTYHSNGNMSIQVHPTESFAKNNFNEHGRQDESYYVVVTGHGAKTRLGLKEDADIKGFFNAIKRSEKEGTPVDYDRYVNAIPSRPGMQFLIPAGTIHSSGRNQVVLEIGSLTVGSYTFKLYDYLRLDLDGKPRPIHSYYGQSVLQVSRREKWVKENLVQQPRLIRHGEGWAEYIVGEHDLIYFSLRRLEFENEIECDTQGIFHVLTLVDGEKVMVQSKENPDLCYEQNWLDIVVVPADVGKYIIKNLGNQPVCIHKTQLKDDFYNDTPKL